MNKRFDWMTMIDVTWLDPSLKLYDFDLSEENLGPPIPFTGVMTKLLYLIKFTLYGPPIALIVDDNDKVCLLSSEEEEGSQYTHYYTLARYLKSTPNISDRC